MAQAAGVDAARVDTASADPVMAEASRGCGVGWPEERPHAAAMIMAAVTAATAAARKLATRAAGVMAAHGKRQGEGGQE